MFLVWNDSLRLLLLLEDLRPHGAKRLPQCAHHHQGALLHTVARTNFGTQHHPNHFKTHTVYYSIHFEGKWRKVEERVEKTP